MSVSGILSSSLFNLGASSIQRRIQKSSQDFQQLGQDLQAGNLSAAQSDFATLQSDRPQAASSSSSTDSADPISQAFSKLSQDLQSGNISGAQQDYATLQQDFQNKAASVHGHHHHHHSSGDSQNSITQAFTNLIQSLQTGGTSAAQQAYSTLQQSLQQFASMNGLVPPGASSASSSSLSVSA